MTQQQYGQPQFPGYPPQQPQQYAPPPQQPYVQPGYPQSGYPAQQYAPAPQQAPVQPLADGSLDAFYSQPNTGGGPGVSWKGKPDGYTIQGLVPRDVTNADVTQEVGAPNTQQAGVPQTYRDGRPKFVMAVPLALPASQEYPEGEARLFVRGQLRDELARAMSEVQAEGAPKGGAVLTVTLVQRKQGRGTIPQNIFRVVYTPPGAQAPQIQQQYAQQPIQNAQGYPPPQAVPQYQQPAPQVAQQYQQPVQQPQYAPQQVLVQQATEAASPVPVAQQPVPQQGGLQMPPGFNPEQQELFARIAGQAS